MRDYWNILLDILPDFKKLNHFVQRSIDTEQQGDPSIPYLIIKNRSLLHDYLLTASERFKLIMFSSDKLMEIENRKKISQKFDVDFDDTFEATYHFYSLISLVTSFLNSIAWLIKIIYDINVKRNDIEFRKTSKVIKNLKTLNNELYIGILNSFTWFDELIRFRDVIHHRQNIHHILVMDDIVHKNRIYIPSDPELLIWNYVNNRFETDLEFGRRTEKIINQKGDLTQPLIPFIDDKMKKLIDLTNFICKNLYRKLRSDSYLKQ